MLSPWNILNIHSSSYLTLDQQLEKSMPIKLNMCERNLPITCCNIQRSATNKRIFENKGNNKITELRTILQRESQNS
jgi:hypothetical protein